MLGYTDQALTDDAFDQDGFFRTGDIGRIEFGDFLAVSGRKKDVIVRGGEHISPQEIEDALHRYPAITYVAVGGSEEHTSEIKQIMRISYAAFCLQKKTK